MNDYKELVAQLRAVGEHLKYVSCIYLAADAIEQLVKERDSAVAELHEVLGGGYYSGCEFCIKEEICDIHGHECRPCSGYDAWEWRGVKEDNDEID